MNGLLSTFRGGSISILDRSASSLFPVSFLLRGAVDAGPVSVAALVVVVLVAGLATGALLLRVVVVHVDLGAN